MASRSVQFSLDRFNPVQFSSLERDEHGVLDEAFGENLRPGTEVLVVGVQTVVAEAAGKIRSGAVRLGHVR